MRADRALPLARLCAAPVGTAVESRSEAGADSVIVLGKKPIFVNVFVRKILFRQKVGLIFWGPRIFEVTYFFHVNIFFANPKIRSITIDEINTQVAIFL